MASSLKAGNFGSQSRSTANTEKAQIAAASVHSSAAMDSATASPAIASHGAEKKTHGRRVTFLVSATEEDDGKEGGATGEGRSRGDTNTSPPPPSSSTGGGTYAGLRTINNNNKAEVDALRELASQVGEDFAKLASGLGYEVVAHTPTTSPSSYTRDSAAASASHGGGERGEGPADTAGTSVQRFSISGQTASCLSTAEASMHHKSLDVPAGAQLQQLQVPSPPPMLQRRSTLSSTSSEGGNSLAWANARATGNSTSVVAFSSASQANQGCEESLSSDYSNAGFSPNDDVAVPFLGPLSDLPSGTLFSHVMAVYPWTAIGSQEAQQQTPTMGSSRDTASFPSTLQDATFTPLGIPQNVQGRVHTEAGEASRGQQGSSSDPAGNVASTSRSRDEDGLVVPRHGEQATPPEQRAERAFNSVSYMNDVSSIPPNLVVNVPIAMREAGPSFPLANRFVSLNGEPSFQLQNQQRQQQLSSRGSATFENLRSVPSPPALTHMVVPASAAASMDSTPDPLTPGFQLRAQQRRGSSASANNVSSVNSLRLNSGADDSETDVGEGSHSPNVFFTPLAETLNTPSRLDHYSRAVQEQGDSIR